MGFSPKRLRTAGKRLGVSSTRIGFSGKGHWSWSLPGAGHDGGCLEAVCVEPVAERRLENGESLGIYGECMRDCSDAVAPRDAPAPTSEPRMARIDTNDEQGNLVASDDAESRRAGIAHAERWNEESIGTFEIVPRETVVAAAEPVSSSAAGNACERNRAESRRRRRKMRRNRKKEWKQRLATGDGAAVDEGGPQLRLCRKQASRKAAKNSDDGWRCLDPFCRQAPSNCLT
jgi:hypothetical protein